MTRPKPDDLSRAVTEGDLLEVERELRHWLMGVIGAIVGAALVVGISYADLRSRVEFNTQRIEEVRQEGSEPLHALQLDVAVIKEQQRANSIMLNAIAAKLRIGVP